MIEPEYVDEERLQRIQNYDYPDDKRLLSTTQMMKYQLDDRLSVSKNLT